MLVVVGFSVCFSSLMSLKWTLSGFGGMFYQKNSCSCVILEKTNTDILHRGQDYY